MRKALLYGTNIVLLLTLMVLDTAFAVDVKEISSSFRKKYESMKNFSADFEQTTICQDLKNSSLYFSIFEFLTTQFKLL